MSEALHGHCYCGGMTYEVAIPAGEKAPTAVYCHCDSCRRSHAAPLYQVAIIDAPWFRFTAGEELLEPFRKPGGNIVRAFCRRCGTKMVNQFPGWTPEGWTPLAFFPNTLDAAHQRPFPEALAPFAHSFPEECVLDLELIGRLSD